MTTAREIMTTGADFLKTNQSVADAADCLASSGIGAVPVCETDGHLAGMVTDRDIVIKVVAAGKDPKKVSLSDLADRDEVVTVGADDSVEAAVETMKEHQVRRLPVIDGNEVVGMVSQADLARCIPPEQVGDMISAIST